MEGIDFIMVLEAILMGRQFMSKELSVWEFNHKEFSDKKYWILNINSPCQDTRKNTAFCYTKLVKFYPQTCRAH